MPPTESTKYGVHYFDSNICLNGCSNQKVIILDSFNLIKYSNQIEKSNIKLKCYNQILQSNRKLTSGNLLHNSLQPIKSSNQSYSSNAIIKCFNQLQLLNAIIKYSNQIYQSNMKLKCSNQIIKSNRKIKSNSQIVSYGITPFIIISNLLTNYKSTTTIFNQFTYRLYNRYIGRVYKLCMLPIYIVSLYLIIKSKTIVTFKRNKAPSPN